MIRLKRAYDPPSRDDGKRILIDRLWPRGLKKEEANIDEWVREIAPSNALRKWFGHDPRKWETFKKKFFNELDEHEEIIEKILDILKSSSITLVYASKEERFNNAIALKEYIETRMHGRAKKKAA